MDPQPETVAGVPPEQDVHLPWRVADRGARRVAVAVVAGSVAVVAMGATMPSWTDEETLRVPLVDVSDGFHMVWIWDLPVGAAWWAFALVLLLPCVAVVLGARRTRMRLEHALAHLPAESPPARPGPPMLTPAERFALHYPPRLSVWTGGGRTAALLPGGLTVVAVVVAALGQSDSALGTWFAGAAWFFALLGAVMWCAGTGLMFARIRTFRRTFG